MFTLTERYDPLTGRAWLEVRGTPPRTVPIDEGYGAEREQLRAAWPDRPWHADWHGGTFWPSPWGRPPLVVLLAAVTLACAATVGAGWLVGPWGAVAVALAASWPLLRLLDHASITARGIRLGSFWSMRTPWHEVEAAGVASEGRARTLWVRGRLGAASASVPPVLVPAIRARIRRLGGLEVTDGDGGLDVRYARWRQAALGLPWGALLGTAATLPFVSAPWRVATVGLLVTCGLGALGASIEARATGWGTGAVGWLTVTYAVVLAALTLGPWI
ncbi:MAG: hypothetical protein H6738_13000 [Alphaproteobacteria bacterium]|nr:hypothetical protein [Alphaproteobacteria bacterium]MCB9697693.1 hypothetical protein [Alphaproteobacteria bacterium]